MRREPARRRVYLLRHSDVEYYTPEALRVHPSEVRLTNLGREQARASGVALRYVAFDRVVTSGLARTVETAKLVLEEIGTDPTAPCEAYPELAELRGGPVGDVADEDLEESFLGIWRGVTPHDARFLNGEKIGDFLDRVVPAFQRLVDSPGWHTMLLVLHGAVNRAILSYALTGERVFLGHLEQSTAGFNVIDVDHAFAVRAVNVTPYDLAQADTRSSAIELMLEEYRSTLRARDAAGPVRDGAAAGPQERQ